MNPCYFILLANTANNPFAEMAKPVTDLLEMALVPAMGIVGALGAIYCILLGVKLAKAEEPQDREKAKNSLKNAIVGFILIFVLLVVMRVGTGALSNWVNAQNTGLQLETQVK